MFKKSPTAQMTVKSYQVYHILVKHHYEAEDLLKKINDGLPFEDLAKKFSICGSATAGGDLGLISIGKADHDFEQAALELKIGQMSTKPLRTRFGYHLIKRMK